MKKTSALLDCYLLPLAFFINRFRFQQTVCNGCHDALIMSIDTNNINILNVCGVDYRFVIFRIIKSAAINPSKDADMSIKRGSVQNRKKLVFIVCSIKHE